MIFDYFLLAFKYLKHRLQRTILTVLGIAISLVLISSLLILGTSLKHSVSDQFSSLSPNSVFISVKAQNFMKSLASKGLERDDCNEIEKLPYVDFCTYFKFKYVKVSYKDQSHIAAMILTDKKYFENLNKLGFSISSGKMPKKQEAVVGYLYSTDKIFDKPLKFGDKIIINNNKLKVVGFFQEIGNPQDDTNIYVLDKTFDESNDDKVNMLVVLLKDIKYLPQLKKYFDKKKGQEFRYMTTEAMIEQANQIITIINYAVIAIAIISLIVGSIGISNTLFTSVYERTKDIGIMKAIGAKNSDIFNIVITETFITVFFGTIIGLSLGIGIAKIATMISTNIGYKMPFVISIRDLIFTIAFAILFGFVAAVFPAKKAMSLDPIEAIRK